MEIVIPKGHVQVEGPKGYEVEDTVAIMSGLEYRDIAEIYVSEKDDKVFYSIVDKLECDLRIILKEKPKKKFLGIF